MPKLPGIISINVTDIIFISIFIAVLINSLSVIPAQAGIQQHAEFKTPE